MSEFKLSASLEGHEDDVRSVAFPDSTFVLTASRDTTVRLWKLLSPKPPTYDCSLASNGTSFVNSVAFVPPTSKYPDGLIVSGGRDAIIEARQPGRPPQDNAEALLLGHSGNVCALEVGEDGTIVSGSWDTEARVWTIGKWEQSVVLQGHQASVWAVSIYDKETILTGSADKSIHIYHPSGKLLRKINAPDIVRALAKLPPGHWSNADFASAGNDGAISLWRLDGRRVGQLLGHDSFIYSLTTLPSGEIVSAGEDRTVRIWNKGRAVQVITHPAISVWTVAACAQNGDIVTGSSDRIARVFSRVEERHAAPNVLAEFDEAVKASAIPEQALGGINKTDLPGPEFLTSKSGTKEGQVQMIKMGDGSIAAYQWSQAVRQWVNVGTVVDAAAGSGRKISYEGKDWDYVFDVDIEDGKPPLKLPYNATQNPYEVAQKFITDNELPITYLDQVANFIITNSQGATIGQSTQATHAPGSDPWGTESRYRPGDAGAPPAQLPRPKMLPQTQYLTIATANHRMIQKKIEEFNTAFLKENRKDVALQPPDLEVLAATIKQLESASVKPDTSTPILTKGIDIAVNLATRWPADRRLPGLDLLRLLTAASATTVSHTSSGDTTLIDALIESEVFAPDAPVNNTMLAVRALANLFNTEEGRTLMDGSFEAVHTAVGSLSKSGNRNLLIALTTLYVNYAVLAVAGGDAGIGPGADRAVTLLDEVSRIVAHATDSEALYRALVAAGTLLALGRDFRDLAMEALDFEKVLARAEKVGVEPRIKNVIREIRDELA